MKKAVTVLLALVSFAVFSMGGCAAPMLPATGDNAAPLVPIFIGLMVVAVAAIVVCLVLLKKKK